MTTFLKPFPATMNAEHGADKERTVTKDESWTIFKKYIDEHHPDLNTKKALEPLSLKRTPIISYGIIEFFTGLNDKEEKCAYYHLFRRRNTVEYELLIRGCFHMSQLYDLLSLISQDERERILNNEWEDLWEDMWINPEAGSYQSVTARSKRHFPKVKEVLQLLDEHLVLKILERSFIFPKGRPEPKESGWEAALREAQEETRHSYKEGSLYFNSPIVQHFIGSDNNPYTDAYYVWRTNGYYKSDQYELEENTSPRPRLRNKSISSELESDVWLEIPIFTNNQERMEWINSIDPYYTFNVFRRHFLAIMEIHNHLCIT